MKEITPTMMTEFRDAVATEVESQYPRVDYIKIIVAEIISRKVGILGWEWSIKGPYKKKEKE